MTTRAVKLLKWALALCVVSLLTLLAVRAFDSQRGPSLDLWHTYVPRELTTNEIAESNWTQYLAAEEKVFNEVRTEVTEKLNAESRQAANRYFDGSPLYPGKFAQDWNRSYILEPDGAPIGAAVLLHGLTDSPYSLRGVARRYRDNGFIAIAIRLPGHGTVPGGLTDAERTQWTEATRLAVREARRRAGPAVPLHLIGYSNGGALAMQFALDATSDKALARPDRVVLISPMIGLTTNLAQFAGVLGWPAVFPSFANAAWLGIVPEFNPFKYNSFPVNAARQSSLMVRTLQRQISEAARENQLVDLAPVLTFQSVLDFTVSTPAVVNALYANLPANGSELVLFDLNRNSKFGPLLPSSTDTVLARLLPDSPRRFRTTIVTNASPGSTDVVGRVTEAGATAEATRALDLSYPRDVFSLSHVALPFPMNDPLYGMEPDPAESFGVNLGALAMRGERATLIVDVDFLTRMSANPFFPYMLDRIGETIGGGPKVGPPNATSAR